MTDGRPAQAPMSDLFASAVHRFGTVWADLLVASLVAVAVATAPVVIVHATGGSGAATAITGSLVYAISYFVFVAFVVLRGLPERPPTRRAVWAYATAVLVGGLAGILLIVLQPLLVVVLPAFLFAVPGVAAGDVGPLRVLPYSILLAGRNFTRTYAVWL